MAIAPAVAHALARTAIGIRRSGGHRTAGNMTRRVRTARPATLAAAAATTTTSATTTTPALARRHITLPALRCIPRSIT